MSLVSNSPVVDETPIDDLHALWRAQKDAFLAEGAPSAEVRKNRIDRLLAAVLDAAGPLTEAANADYGNRPEHWSLKADILGVVGKLTWARDNLDEWMKPTEVDDPAAATMPTTVEVAPLGVVGVIGPWNFPVSLVVVPAAEALAAGNRVMIKFSDANPRTARAFAEAIAKYLSPHEVAVVLGGVEVSSAFAALPLDHIFFTGSPAVGKLVQRAASENLTPVTLELGGKNPVVVGHDADIDDAARRIAVSRLVNGGQVCLCPDYVFVPRAAFSSFVDALRAAFLEYYPNYSTNPGVVSVINDKNFQRISRLIEDAIDKGATAILGVDEHEAQRLPNPITRRIAPTILTGVTDDMLVAHEEVFGPVLTVLPYGDITEVIDYVAHRPSPLTAYWYGEDSADFAEFRRRTSTGGITRNDFAVHLNLPDVPFGGVGQSGMGAYHGKAGFDTFSHQRAVATSQVPGSVALTMIPAAMTEAATESLRAAVAAALADVKARL
ncbi:aldehyde dehydrogenase family protein [Mycolicibacterium sp.]|uniref:aldehyde dehydrogenase family protein n=1 Tax=Mycolicibacterium sp. TaxID=2320850 RepID=UPI003D0DAE5B